MLLRPTTPDNQSDCIALSEAHEPHIIGPHSDPTAVGASREASEVTFILIPDAFAWNSSYQYSNSNASKLISNYYPYSSHLKDTTLF